MTLAMTEFEWETLPEWEGEFEFEGEYEGEIEGEEFLGSLASAAGRIGQRTIRNATPVLRRIGLSAVRSALRGSGQLGAALGSAVSPRGARIGRNIVTHVGVMLSNMLPQREYEGEFEVNPTHRIYPEALMEHLAHAAVNAESEAEAKAFIGALVPVAARLLPQAARVIARVTPQLTRGLTSAARTLRRQPSTRPLMRTLPTVARNTVAQLAQQAAAGRPVTPRLAANTLARQTASVIGNPHQCLQVMRRSRMFDQRYHRAARSTTPQAAIRQRVY